MQQIYLVMLVIIRNIIVTGIATDGDYQLTVLHTNDIHARIEQTNKFCGVCKYEAARKSPYQLLNVV